MKYILSLLLVATITLSSATAHANDTAGAGAKQCGEFLDDVENMPGAEYIYEGWMQGFLTARNYFRAFEGGPMLDLSGNVGQRRWLKTYCEDNPLDSVLQGVVALMFELEERQIKN